MFGDGSLPPGLYFKCTIYLASFFSTFELPLPPSFFWIFWNESSTLLSLLVKEASFSTVNLII